MADDLTIEDYSRDLQLQANRISGIVEEVTKAIAEGNLDGASLVLGTQTGKVAEFNEAYQALSRKLTDEGADYQRALDRGSQGT